MCSRACDVVDWAMCTCASDVVDWAMCTCAEGRALLMLLPTEQEAMLRLLQEAKVPLKAIKMNPQKQQPITGALQALLSKDSALKVCPALPCPALP